MQVGQKCTSNVGTNLANKRKRLGVMFITPQGLDSVERMKTRTNNWLASPRKRGGQLRRNWGRARKMSEREKWAVSQTCIWVKYWKEDGETASYFFFFWSRKSIGFVFSEKGRKKVWLFLLLQFKKNVLMTIQEMRVKDDDWPVSMPQAKSYATNQVNQLLVKFESG